MQALPRPALKMVSGSHASEVERTGTEGRDTRTKLPPVETMV